ncbi:MAG: carbohydrate ABC transporter permease [Firmicutes bacterium]|nr:carbohydrate ABC transporter permease [Bacillota bacterium]
MGIKRKATTGYIVIMIILFLLVLMCLIPLLNTLAISFSDKVSAQNGNVFVWPVNFTVNPYREILKDTQFFISFLISVRRVIVGSIINIFLAVLTAYPLSKSPAHFRSKNRYMWFVVAMMLFPPGLIPSYILVSKLGMINTIWALVVPGALPIFATIMLMNSYKQVPASLEEAALIDGAGPVYILTRIFIPLSKATIAVVALWQIVYHWNDFFLGMIYMTKKELYPLQTYIQSLTVSINWQDVNNMKGEDIARMLSVSNLTFNSAKVVISLIPILIVYPFLQRYFVTGIVMGAVKE